MPYNPAEDVMVGWHLTQWTWVWVISGSWWWTGRPGVLRLMWLQRVGHDWETELNWTEQPFLTHFFFSPFHLAKLYSFIRLQFRCHIIERNPRADLLQNGLVGSPCSPRDSQESPPTPQFNSINSLALSLLHSPTLTPIHDHRKNHSLVF